MYLVEITAGREKLYPSVAALASAIRRGDVGPHSRIFHRASSRWLSITVHPEYRKVAAEKAREPLPPLARNQWTFFGTEPVGREFDEPGPTDGATAEPAPAESNPRPGWRGILRRAFGRRSSSPRQ